MLAGKSVELRPGDSVCRGGVEDGGKAGKFWSSRGGGAGGGLGEGDMVGEGVVVEGMTVGPKPKEGNERGVL